MDTTAWTGVIDGNGYNAANWTDGLPSDTKKRVRIAESDRLITGIDFSGSGDADIESLFVGGLFKGSIGTAMEALQFNSFEAYPVGEARIDVANAPANQILNFNFPSCPTFAVSNCGANDHACYLSGGNYGTVFIEGGQKVRIGAAVSIDHLIVKHNTAKPRPTVYIEDGADITNWDIGGSVVNAYGDLGDVVVSGGGILYLVASNPVTIGSLRSYGGGAVYAQGNGGTFTLLETHDNSLVDSETDSAREWTYSASKLLGGTLRAKPMDEFETAPLLAGGKLLGWPGSRVILVPSEGM